MAILALDQGTSGSKAVVVDDDGVHAVAEHPIHPEYLANGGVEQDPMELLGSLLRAGKEAVAKANKPIEGVALANQGETVLAWDPAHDPSGAATDLIELYRTDITRHRARVTVGVGTPHEGVVELALDLGHIHAGDLDVPVRELEGLPQQTGLLYGVVPDKVEMQENGVRFLVDVKNGQKTGFFLDQKENRAAIAPFVRGQRVLDCFTHTGSFALHAGHYGAAEVTGVDISDYACECARENAALNGLNNVQFVAANVFDLLKEKTAEGDRYDAIILDPPAFTKTRSAVDAAVRGYKEINLRAMKLLRDGGYLITCSCSQHILPQMFQGIVQSAAADTHTHLQQVEFRTQGRDHPILPALPETQYLKCGIYRVER